MQQIVMKPADGIDNSAAWKTSLLTVKPIAIDFKYTFSIIFSHAIASASFFSTCIYLIIH